jgi:hypothetical protein
MIVAAAHGKLTQPEIRELSRQVLDEARDLPDLVERLEAVGARFGDRSTGSAAKQP